MPWQKKECGAGQEGYEDKYVTPMVVHKGDEAGRVEGSHGGVRAGSRSA